LREVLHYTGYDGDEGGIVSVVRALADERRFGCILGVNRGAQQRRLPALPQREFPGVAGESISWPNLLRARRVAWEVREWLHTDERRIFHAHSRAGLLVALWLQRWGERRCVVSVHCYGRQRWFYRWAARRLGRRLFWLSPAMRAHYGATGAGWENCLPGGVGGRFFALAPADPLPGRLRLGGIGARVRWKQWEMVPAALRALREPGVTFQHIGSETDAAYARELRAGSGEGVSWREAEPDATRLLGEIDVIVCASQCEPFSMAMQEALAAGVPVLAAASGGALDLIRPGVTGWLFADGDVTSLTEQLRVLVATRAWERLDRPTLRAAAWDAPRVAARWAEIYSRLG
jgi:glycosyltransferase involved in cell wall biosynthesis